MDEILPHKRIDHSKCYSLNGVNTNTMECFWGILKRGIIGQYHKVSDKYLPLHISEFTYKFNRRKDEICDIFNNAILRAVTV
ncbi:MAG: ISXO2-like transposase domain protein [Candidatus Izimaplasma bacterium HR2]|nr:MAG: ISXO2-like transposase domain protein [Candidatus Izimaplasma bacterium HR2]